MTISTQPYLNLSQNTSTIPNCAQDSQIKLQTETNEFNSQKEYEIKIRF